MVFYVKTPQQVFDVSSYTAGSWQNCTAGNQAQSANYIPRVPSNPYNNSNKFVFAY